MSEINQARQGDVLVERIEGVVPNFEDPRQWKVREDRVVAAGEATGHHHRVTPGSDVLEPTRIVGMPRNMAMAVRVSNMGGSLVHEEHGTINLAPGYYQVIQQTEYTPKKQVRVRD